MQHNTAVPPSIVISDTMAAFVGRALTLRPHRKAVTTIAVTLDVPFTLELHQSCGSALRTVEQTCAVIEPHQLHRIASPGRMLFLYVDASREVPDLAALAGRAPAQLARDLAAAGASALTLMTSVETALGLAPTATTDPGFAAALEMLRTQPDKITTVKQAAMLAQLSPSHFQKRLKDACGVAFRPYRLWQRMRLAVLSVRRGSPMTAAALDAGFSSSAHFSASFRQMFGLSMTALLKANVAIDAVRTT